MNLAPPMHTLTLACQCQRNRLWVEISLNLYLQQPSSHQCRL